ncbi:MAG: TAXI family TRAP transporter solute-binding subunit [Gammaproteobacteria bacterium]|nr:TAXI family TRAP transporter solute-binding subunit [Gammaproteobacteria bacterium]
MPRVLVLGWRWLADHFIVLGPATVLCLVGFAVAYQFIDPAPPSRVSIAAGSPEGAYYQFAMAYKAHLAAEGVELEVLQSEGSIDNLRLLTSSTPVDAAFVQGGVPTPEAADDFELLSLGSLYYEPVWLFHTDTVTVARLGDLKGLRVGVGAQNSGTRALAQLLLGQNGIDGQSATLRPLGGKQAADALLAGELDAVFFVASPRSAVVKQLLEAPQVALLSFDRAHAYSRIHRFLTPLTLPQGVVDLERNIPAQTQQLLGTTANLVARSDLHPALVDLLMQAASATHQSGGIFEASGDFPMARHLLFPLSDEAKRFYKSGPPFLQRYLPFWAATFLDRIKVMIVPLFALLLPMFKLAPPIYRWRVRSQIYRWYKDLQQLEEDARAVAPTQDARVYLKLIDDITAEVTREKAPPAYADELYNLRFHLERVRAEITALSAVKADAAHARGAAPAQAD